MGETLFADRYELHELVGSGGMSSVYRAHDTLLERDVALKIIHEHYVDDEEYVERFRREARAVAQLSHPSIVTVIDRGDAEGRHFIVFEYVDGRNLKQLIEESGPLPIRRALELTLETARGLAFAHERGIVHRDVKPQNVLLNGDGRAKVTDFGIARSVDIEGVTQAGTVLGTSNYISPEQASGEPVDLQSDVYSLGVVLYELLAGDLPFPGESFVAVALKHVNEPPPSLLERRPDVPLRVAAVVERALRKEPSERFPSMRELIAELEACLAELGEPDGDATAIVRERIVPARRARPARRRRRWPLVLAALALLAALAVAGALALRGGSDGGGGSPTQAVRLDGIGSFDPPSDGGDGTEHDEDVANATDRNPDTYWTTETYRTFAKSGVGLVLDAGQAVELSSIELTTSTPGFTARIRAGDSATGPDFRDVSPSRTVGGTATFPIDGSAARYYVVWITRLSSVARVNEVRARR